jgi:hypothetical protein
MHPVFIDDIDALRARVLGSHQQEGRQQELWQLIKRSAQSAPFAYPWFTPFVALMTRDPQDIANAAEVMRRYVGKLDSMYFSTGLQFHFWCFAFPHAKWCLYFQWLCSVGAFAEAEATAIAEQLIEYHFVNFLYGLRTKPEPECVDNQALSLALSTTLVGYLFAQAPYHSRMAAIMRDEGLRRLPGIVGDMPASGYSGEGSSYMDCVNGPAIPLVVELLERITGERGLLMRPLRDNGASPYRILQMVAREWMPGGLLLPWDNYGYQFGVRAALAYGARHTGDPLFADILAHECIWSYDIGTGWAYDDLVWTLIWWPEAEPHTPVPRSWFEPEVGGALVSEQRHLYAMQMWDAATPVVPTRAHVNPNAVIFNGYGVPLSADGAPTAQGVPRFQFADTVRQVNFLTMGQIDEYNYGDGCGGAHSIVLVDDWEGLRVFGDGVQWRAATADLTALTVACDVAPTYQERWPNIGRMYRRTSLCAQRFFVIEDVCEAAAVYRWTTRFVLRPTFVPAAAGAKIMTPEGVTLHLVPVYQPVEVGTEEVSGHPAKPDGQCGVVDFVTTGRHHHQLTIAWIATTRRIGAQIRQFVAVADRSGTWDEVQARHQLATSMLRLDAQLPAHMEADVAVERRWWYQVRVPMPADARWIRLPLGMMQWQLWLNGLAVDVSPWAISGELIAPQVPIPEALWQRDTLDILLRVDVPVSHYEGGGDGTIGLNGGVWWVHPTPEEELVEWQWAEGMLRVRTTQQWYAVPYQLVEKEGV